MAIGSPTLGVGAEGTGKLGVTGAFELPGSLCSGGSGASIGLGGELGVGVVLIVNRVSVAVAELEGDAPVASNPDRPASFALFWPHGAQVETRDVHIANVPCCI